MTMTTMTLLALKGVGILAAATVVNALLAKAPASLRHLVWTAALAAVLALPVLDATGIRLEVPVPAPWIAVEEAEPLTPAPVVHAVQRAAYEPTERTPRPSGKAGAPMARAHAVAPEAHAATVEIDEDASDFVAQEHADESVRDVAERASTERPAVASGPSGRTAGSVLAALDPAVLATGAVVLWGAGALLLLALALLGQVRAWRVTTRGVRLAPVAVRRRLDDLATVLDIRRRVDGVVSPDVQVPATWGMRSATIVLPEHHVAWSAETLERVLLHELAHIRRRDCLTQLLGELTRAVHWPNPLTWLAAHRQRLESERACDDRVLAHGEAASDYAGDLVGLVRALKGRGPLPRAALAIADPSGVGGRVRAILDPRRARGEVGRVAAATIAVVATALALSVSGLVPVAVAQDHGVPTPPPAPTLHDLVFDASEAPAAIVLEHAPAPTLPAPPHYAPTSNGPGYSALLPDVAQASIPEGMAWLVGTLTRLGPAAQSQQSQEMCVFREGERRSSNYNIDDDEVRIRIETSDCRLDIDMEGEIEFAPDDSGITAMEDGALFEIEERVGRTRQRARLEGRGGQIERRYWVDGSEAEWGPDAEQWIAQVLPELFRNTTINAPERVARLLAAGGPEAVFDEVALIRSDHVASTYLELMVEQADLGESDYARVIDFASRIDSDHQAAQLLMTVVERAGLRPAFQEPILRAAATLESDHQKAQVLETFLRQDLSPDQLDTVVRAAQDIDSDHQLATVLSSVARQRGLSAAGRASFIETLESIESDHQHASVLETFLDSGQLTPDELSLVLDMMRSIESDHQKAMVLQRIARDYPLTGEQVTVYLRAASMINSDHQLASTAEAIVSRAEFSEEQLELVLAMADGISSDHQRSIVLDRVIERRDLSPREMRLVLGVAAEIGSDHQLSEVLRRLIQDERLEPDGIVDVLAVTGEVSSDHQRSEVMVDLAGRYAIEGEALTRYRALAEEMGEHQRDRALAALVRGAPAR